jgi:hypothetical protein
MKILITEEQYRDILLERLGVADNLLDSANNIYDEIINTLLPFAKSDNKIPVNHIGFIINGNFNIGKIKKNEAEISFKFKNKEFIVACDDVNKIFSIS